MSSVQSTWGVLGLALNVASILCCVLFCAHCVLVYLRQRQTKQHLRQQELRSTINIARQCIAAAKLSAVEIAVLAVEAGMKAHDVYREYVNDEHFRREIVEALLADIGKKMIEKHPSRFLSHGYAQQMEFVEALPPGQRRRMNISIRLPVTDVRSPNKQQSVAK